jgi:hypothetical protein
MARAIADDCIPPKFLQSYKVLSPVKEEKGFIIIMCFFITVPVPDTYDSLVYLCRKLSFSDGPSSFALL